MFTAINSIANTTLIRAIFETVFPEINSEFKELGKSVGWYSYPWVRLWKDCWYSLCFGGRYWHKRILSRLRYTRNINDWSIHTPYSVSERVYVYNDRLHLKNIKTSPGKPYVLWRCPDDYVPISPISGKIIVSLKTMTGKCVVGMTLTQQYA